MKASVCSLMTIAMVVALPENEKHWNNDGQKLQETTAVPGDRHWGACMSLHLSQVNGFTQLVLWFIVRHKQKLILRCFFAEHFPLEHFIKPQVVIYVHLWVAYLTLTISAYPCMCCISYFLISHSLIVIWLPFRWLIFSYLFWMSCRDINKFHSNSIEHTCWAHSESTDTIIKPILEGMINDLREHISHHWTHIVTHRCFQQVLPSRSWFKKYSSMFYIYLHWTNPHKSFYFVLCLNVNAFTKKNLRKPSETAVGDILFFPTASKTP